MKFRIFLALLGTVHLPLASLLKEKIIVLCIPHHMLLPLAILLKAMKASCWLKFLVAITAVEDALVGEGTREASMISIIMLDSDNRAKTAEVAVGEQFFNLFPSGVVFFEGFPRMTPVPIEMAVDCDTGA